MVGKGYGILLAPAVLDKACSSLFFSLRMKARGLRMETHGLRLEAC